MSYQEKRSFTYIISYIIGYSLYYFYVIQSPDSWTFLQFENEFAFWGTVMLLLFPFQILVSIITHILMTIFLKVTTNEDEPTIVDEFDKIVQLKTGMSGIITFFFGFLIAMATQAFGMQPSAMFISFYFTFFMTGLIIESTEIYFYRRGF